MTLLTIICMAIGAFIGCILAEILLWAFKKCFNRDTITTLDGKKIFEMVLEQNTIAKHNADKSLKETELDPLTCGGYKYN